MPLDVGNSLFGGSGAALGVKAFLVLFLIFYTVFAVILYRQIGLLNRKMTNSLAPVLKFVAFVHIGVTLALLFLTIGGF